jgi:glyoxylase-like metal-dependent hydrolase (beta-lactamase superfamily II)
MEIYPGVHEIKSVFGDRYLQQYLFVGDRIVLIDAGVVATPAESIFPYMEKIGLAPERLSLVIAMHADADHHGGLAAVKRISRGSAIACHRADLDLIENPERLYQDRYNFLAHDHGLGFGREGMVHCPERCSIDEAFSGGESVQLAKDWSLDLWHVPGHSAGHMAAYDARHRAAFTSDAVQSNGYPTIDAGLAFGPTYYTVEAYLATINFLENKPIEHMYSGHWPAAHDGGVADFLRSSRDFVECADDLLIRYLRDRHSSATLREILGDLSSKLGDWPDSGAPFLQFALYGHLERLSQIGTVRKIASMPVEYELV